MEYRRLGKSGLPVSALSFGSWVTFSTQMGVEQALETMTAAYDAGVNFFDNAEVYASGKSETIMGQALQKSGWSRDSYIVSSKVMWGSVEDPQPTQRGLHRKHVFEACHDALHRLQVDYLDLYYCHRPDPDVPVEESARAMHDLITQGKVLYWGTSEWDADRLAEAFAVCDRLNLHRPIVEQPQYNLFRRARVEQEFAPFYRSPGLGTTVWSPLATGLLTGKYNDGVPADSRLNTPGMEWLRDRLTNDPRFEAKLAAVRQLAKLAGELGTSVPRLALAWCLKNPHVSSVILGASRVEQLQENFGALAVVDQLTPEVMQRINALTAPLAD